MEVIINQKILSFVLNKLRNIVERKTANEKLQHILLTLEDGKLLIEATDKEIMVLQHVEVVKIIKDGSALVPAHLFSDIVKKAPDSCEITLKVVGSNIEVTYGKAKFILNTLPSENFPKISMDKSFDVEISLSTEEFIDVLNKIKCAISSDEIRYYLNGMFLHINNHGDLVAVSTDAHKLARRIIFSSEINDLNKNNLLRTGVIVPRKAISEIHKFINSKSDKFIIKLSSSAIQFEQDGKVIMYSSLIDGVFPDYQGILDNRLLSKSVVIPNISDLSEAISRVSLLSTDNSKRIVLNFNKNNLDVSIVDARAGSAVDSVPVIYDGDNKSIIFNYNYALSIFDNFLGKVEINIDTEISPAIIHSSDSKETTYVLMPMHSG